MMGSGLLWIQDAPKSLGKTAGIEILLLGEMIFAFLILSRMLGHINRFASFRAAEMQILYINVPTDML